VIAFGLLAILAVGGLFASNMGFKLNYPLNATGTGGSLSGNNVLALPFNQQTNLVNAFDLIQDINATPPAGSKVVQVGDWTKSTNSFALYNGTAGVAFALVPGTGYLVQVNTNVNYIVVGSHDPGLVVALDAAGTNGSLSGNNIYGYPYHSVSNDAFELIQEINAAAGAAAVVQVGNWTKSTNSFALYNGTAGVAFPLVPGAAYLVQVNQNVTLIPDHY
jgi:hypothetical protein